MDMNKFKTEIKIFISNASTARTALKSLSDATGPNGNEEVQVLSLYISTLENEKLNRLLSQLEDRTGGEYED